ncbi:leukocyte elastase inhibitor-like [Procambarus clarkii]|uniref:leukocyte elastase inhibitor-like n=1 Tax=Procambarus clarkii TaxID=6728 RepID=UPI0037440BFE
MRKLWCAAVLVVTLVSVVRPQCISNNDKLVTSRRDLAHITPFSLDLFKQLYPPTATGNFFFSPYSVWTALVLAYFGSAGRTRQQLQDTLRLRDPSTTLATYRALDRLTAERQSNTSDYVIHLANKVYVKSGFPLRDCIRDVLKKEVENIDFSQAAKAAATINQFVNKTTRGKIPTVVTESDVAPTLMALVNTVYFKGFWLSQFDLTQTTKQKFFTTPGQHSLVDMMTQLGKFRFGVSSELGATVLKIPYKLMAGSMFVLLPDNTPGSDPGKTSTPLDAMLRRLSQDTLHHALTNLKEEKVDLHFPRFKLEQTITEELKAALEALGIEDLFSSRSDLTNYVRGTNLSVNTVIHKAVVEVNEEGSYAGADIIALFIDRGPGLRVFRCDRPFVFVIRDNHTNTILFMGVYRKP